mgnify:CR=1 FL=1
MLKYFLINKINLKEGRFMNNSFKEVAATSLNKNYEKLIKREKELFQSPNEIRQPFARDYTRILHSTAYRRLKHKTQVFYNIESDHICTRMEHVLHVESVSYTIAKTLELNDELTHAIAMGHDLGHAPFGHYGESVINKLSKQYLGKNFWHERNGLYFVDNIELLPDHSDNFQNLNLTYAVRDGIISHCGERDINSLRPRNEFIDLQDFTTPGQYNPVTYEGCVVKIADKIAYIGRDIEDAISLGFLSENSLKELSKIVKLDDNSSVINTSTIMGNMIRDICKNSSVEKGICLSEEMSDILNKIKQFNYIHIYGNKRFEPFKKYAELIINEIFNTLLDCYDNGDIFGGLEKKEKFCKYLIGEFRDYLIKYCETCVLPKQYQEKAQRFKNKKIYEKLQTKELYIQAIIDYIAGMTDRYAVKTFNDLITY